MAQVKTAPSAKPTAATGVLRLVSLKIPSGFDGEVLARVLASLQAMSPDGVEVYVAYDERQAASATV